jgi:hypothetical protein
MITWCVLLLIVKWGRVRRVGRPEGRCEGKTEEKRTRIDEFVRSRVLPMHQCIAACAVASSSHSLWIADAQQPGLNKYST